jgi:hypothetical protein
VVVDPDGSQLVAAFAGGPQAVARTITVTTRALVDPVRGGREDVAVVQRTYGVASDQGATAGARGDRRRSSSRGVRSRRIRAWSSRTRRRAGDHDALVLPGGEAPGPAPITVDVPAGRTVRARRVLGSGAGVGDPRGLGDRHVRPRGLVVLTWPRGHRRDRRRGGGSDPGRVDPILTTQGSDGMMCG